MNNNKSKRSDRETCYAKALILENNLPGYVRDISQTGCRIDLINSVDWEPGDNIKVAIIPDPSLEIGSFRGTLEIRWVKKSEIYYLVGAQIISVKDEESRKNYKRLLHYYEKLSKDRN